MTVNQRVAILIDGNNIGISIHNAFSDPGLMLNFKTVVPALLRGRTLNRLYFFREGRSISEKLASLLKDEFFGVVQSCGKNADIHMAITATQIADKVDTIILMTGDGDFLPLVSHLKARGIRVEIASVLASTHRDLLAGADDYYEIKKEDCFSMFRSSPQSV